MKFYFATTSEPANFVCVKSSTTVTVALPDDYAQISAAGYRKLRWLDRKLRVLNKAEKLKSKAANVKKALVE